MIYPLSFTWRPFPCTCLNSRLMVPQGPEASITKPRVDSHLTFCGLHSRLLEYLIDWEDYHQLDGYRHPFAELWEFLRLQASAPGCSCTGPAWCPIVFSRSSSPWLPLPRHRSQCFTCCLTFHPYSCLDTVPVCVRMLDLEVPGKAKPPSRVICSRDSQALTSVKPVTEACALGLVVKY